MAGLITTRHLFTCAPIVIRYFGLRVYLRCLRRALLSRDPCTFVGVLAEVQS